MPDTHVVHDPHDWLTQRAAAQQLHEDLGIHPETARRLLVAGAAGSPRMTTVAAFHRRDDVDAFVAQHREQAPLPVPDRNLVLVRVGNGRVRFGAREQHQLDRLADGWRMSPKWRALCRGVVDAGGRPVGFLATLGGFVVAGADIVGAEWSGADDPVGTAPQPVSAPVSPLMTRFTLRPPGSWFDEWHARHLPTGRGGSALRFWSLGSTPPWQRLPRERRSGGRALR